MSNHIETHDKAAMRIREHFLFESERSHIEFHIAEEALRKQLNKDQDGILKEYYEAINELEITFPIHILGISLENGRAE